MRAILLAVALVAAPLAGCAGSQPAPGGEGAAASWTVVDTEGREHTASSTRGQVLVVFFMATWCPSCQRMTEDMAEVHQAYAGQGVQMLSVSWDPEEDHEDLEEWKESYDQPWPHGIDRAFAIHQAYGISRQSSVIVLDSQGALVERWGYGQADAEAVSQAIDRAMAGG